MKPKIVLDIIPVAKPRMTQRDKWEKRKPVMKYRAFADEVRLKMPPDFDFNGSAVRFIIPMPKSWSAKKRFDMMGTPHTQKPDIDNLLKALLDSYLEDDSGVHTITVQKVWAEEGGIIIYPEEQVDVVAEAPQEGLQERVIQLLN